MPDYGLLRSPATRTYESVATALLERANLGQRTLSFEYFPPKDELSEKSLWDTFDTLQGVSPDFVSVTYGAGGSNKEKSLSVVDKMAGQVLTIGHLTCVGASRVGSIEILKRFEAAGVRSVLALRGDAPKDNPDALTQGELKSALDLVNLATTESNLEIGVAAFPEGHPESPSLEHDATVLKLKENAGARFAVTQLFFSVEHYLELVRQSANAGVSLPIIPGIMPVANAKQVLRMATLSGAAIPTNLVTLLETASESEARRIGMNFTIELGQKLLEVGAPGLHVFTLNQPAAALELSRGVGLCA